MKLDRLTAGTDERMELHDSEKEMSAVSERLTNNDINDDEIIADEEYSDKPCQCNVSSQKICFVVQMYMTYGLMGWNASVLGPSLTDLAIHSSSSLEQAVNLITCLYLGFLCGAIILAPLMSRLDTHLNLCISLFVVGIATSLYSWFPSLVAMGAFVVLSGIGNNAALVAVSTECLMVMGKRSPSVIQGAMFVFSLFAATSSWIIRPLLSSSKIFSATETGAIENNGTTSTTEITINEHNFEKVTNDSRIQYAFLLIGSSILVLGMTRLVQFVKQKRNPLHRKTNNPTICDGNTVHVIFHTKVKYVVLFLVFNFLFVSIDVIWALFSSVYVAKYFAVSKKDATLIPFLYWGCVTGSRLVNTILSRWLSPGNLSLLASIGMFVTAVTLVIAGEDNQTTLLFCSAFTGFFIGPLLGSSISWLSSLIGPCTTASATRFCGSSMPGMSTGPLVAWLCATFGYRMYSYTLLVLSGSLLFVTSIIHVIIKASLENGICSHLPKISNCKMCI